MKRVTVVLIDGESHIHNIVDEDNLVEIPMCVSGIPTSPMIVPIEDYVMDGENYIIARQVVGVTDEQVEAALRKH